MYMVYWTEAEANVAGPRARAFGSEEMAAAMQFMEELRNRQRAGQPVSMITMASENPHSIGRPGVADAGPDYAWKKRRR